MTAKPRESNFLETRSDAVSGIDFPYQLAAYWKTAATSKILLATARGQLTHSVNYHP